MLHLGVASGTRFITPYARSATWSLLAPGALHRPTMLLVSRTMILSAGLVTSILLTGWLFFIIQALSDNWQYM